MSLRNWSMLRGSPARFAAWASASSDAHARHRPLGGEVAGHEVGGPIGVGEAHDPPFLHRRLVAPGGLLGLHGESEPPHPGSELTGGEVLRLLQHGVGHTAGLCFLQVTGALTDHPGPGQIDPAPAQGLPHPGEPLEEVEGQPEMAVGGSPGETQGRSDLLGGELVDRWHPLRRGGIGGAVGHLGHGGVELGLVVGDLTGQHLHQRDHIVTAQPRTDRCLPGPLRARDRAASPPSPPAAAPLWDQSGPRASSALPQATSSSSPQRGSQWGRAFNVPQGCDKPNTCSTELGSPVSFELYR